MDRKLEEYKRDAKIIQDKVDRIVERTPVVARGRFILNPELSDDEE